jgi:hypothetical protein
MNGHGKAATGSHRKTSMNGNLGDYNYQVNSLWKCLHKMIEGAGVSKSDLIRQRLKKLRATDALFAAAHPAASISSQPLGGQCATKQRHISVTPTVFAWKMGRCNGVWHRIPNKNSPDKGRIKPASNWRCVSGFWRLAGGKTNKV